ncbi:DUF1998 domain-containing protein [Actinoalloteichus spitiensis]|uniref:DUF1998 domain-containing protein n=1 Tax=Actinoalloteichus spitiensis TaxID=252394 RepID=UPI000367A87D|nr:DUF1998 domain-containing protein [Actinoalloteichus spitiensis]
MTDDRFLYDPDTAVDPLGDAEATRAAGRSSKHNYAKVGSGRPSSLLYNYGPGAIMDLPHFTVMSTGLDDWERMWRKRVDPPPEIHAPRLREVVAKLLRSRNVRLRPHPNQPRKTGLSREGNDLGVPARVFPQWMRCTGCDLLAPLSHFGYTNTHPYRPDQARFEHERCPGRSGSRSGKNASRAAVPARYLLACVDGHLDEFPYDQWVHHWSPCPKVEFPVLRMVDRTAGKGASAVIHCATCGARRPMNEAQGDAGRSKLPRCRGRHPHLDAFELNGCGDATRLMLVGASNLWFPMTQSIIVMPRSAHEETSDLAARIRVAFASKPHRLEKYEATGDLEGLRDALDGKLDGPVDEEAIPDDQLAKALGEALTSGESDEDLAKWRADWDPVDLLVPEWNYLLTDPLGLGHEDEASGLTLSHRDRAPGLRKEIVRVLAVERLRKVNALVGFTRIDDVDRVADLSQRMVPLARAARPAWTVATEDRGEGIFLQLDEPAVAAWEAQVEQDQLWLAHRAAHRRNFESRTSDTAGPVDAEDRLRPPRYWLVHTLAHVLIREMALECGYSAASLSERLYAWPGSDGRPPAAGLLICTTAPDSDGTLGGLVQLSEPERLHRVVSSALYRAGRCSSDPVCGMRTPQDTEDFLHGAACHCCAMASETSCERANRFLDRRFLIDLPGSGIGFFGLPG